MEVQVKNFVYHELMRLLHCGSHDSSLHHIPMLREPLACVKEVRGMWEGRMVDSINTLSSRLDQPLSCKRTESEQGTLRKRWNSLGTLFPSDNMVQPLFCSSDLMKALSHIENHNFIADPTLDAPIACVLIKVHLNGKSLYELRDNFSRLHPSTFHIDFLGGREVQNGAKDDYTERASKVVKLGLAPLSRQLCQSGCPVSLRRHLWCQALGVDLTDDQHSLHFEQLKSSIFEQSLLLDRLVVKDVKEVATNNDNYFIFEDLLYQVLLALIRDSSFSDLHSSHTSSHTSVAHVVNDTCRSSQEVHSSLRAVCPFSGSSHQIVYPPSGIIPFKGFSLYMAPLGYLCDQAEYMYALFGELYRRFFVHLHTISSRAEGILGLCCLFESLLQTKLPAVCQHLKTLGVEPLTFAFPWMMTAFAGHLSTEEVLLLWDRIIGFNSLEVLPVFAVSIFQFRASNLLQAVNHVDVEAIVEDLRCLKVLLLLQQTLF